MHVVITADDGDRVTVQVDAFAIEQAMVRLELDNPAYAHAPDFECISLSAERARELGRALLTAAQVIEFNADAMLPTPVVHAAQVN